MSSSPLSSSLRHPPHHAAAPLIEWCHQGLETEVRTVHPAQSSHSMEDLHSAADLVKKLPHQNPHRISRSCGFLASRFVSPPINIEFTFPVAIDIECIAIDPIAQLHASRDVTLYAQRAEPSSTTTKENGDTSNSENFVYIGKCQIDSPETYQSPVSMVFGPRTTDMLDFAARNRSFLIPKKENGSKTFVQTEFSNKSSLLSVKRLKVTLQRAGKSGICALKDIEIWGRISHSKSRSSNTETGKENLLAQWNKMQERIQSLSNEGDEPMGNSISWRKSEIFDKPITTGTETQEEEEEGKETNMSINRSNSVNMGMLSLGRDSSLESTSFVPFSGSGFRLVETKNVLQHSNPRIEAARAAFSRHLDSSLYSNGAQEHEQEEDGGDANENQRPTKKKHRST